MKKTILFLALAITTSIAVLAQTFPYGINYQAVARDANGNAKVNQAVTIRFSINKSTAGGTLIWQETNSTTTNSMGQFNLVIGNGTTTGGGSVSAFSAIDWNADIHFLKVELFNGSSYDPIGTAQQFQSVPYALAAPDATPPGTVVAYMGTTPPAGWLLCDGTAINRTTYAKLYLVLGNSCGYGNNSTTFNLPDFRGMFLRGMDGTAGNDPDKLTRTASNTGGNTGNAVGSEETDAFQGHWHTLGGTANGADGATIPMSRFQATGGASSGTVSTSMQNENYIRSPKTDGVNGSPLTSIETRPKNVNVNYIIKY